MSTKLYSLIDASLVIIFIKIHEFSPEKLTQMSKTSYLTM